MPAVSRVHRTSMASIPRPRNRSGCARRRGRVRSCVVVRAEVPERLWTFPGTRRTGGLVLRCGTGADSSASPRFHSLIRSSSAIWGRTREARWVIGRAAVVTTDLLFASSIGRWRTTLRGATLSVDSNTGMSDAPLDNNNIQLQKYRRRPSALYKRRFSSWTLYSTYVLIKITD